VGIAEFGGRIFKLFVAPLGKLSANDFDVFVLSLSLILPREITLKLKASTAAPAADQLE
jgi:hypothetical protein